MLICQAWPHLLHGMECGLCSNNVGCQGGFGKTSLACLIHLVVLEYKNEDVTRTQDRGLSGAVLVSDHL